MKIMTIRAKGFFLSKTEMDIWMCEKDGAYKYIGVYVDNLFIVSKNHKAIMDVLVNDYKFKLKGTGPVEFHLGCDFFRDEDGHLCFTPRKYIEKMLSNYKQMFGVLPRDAALPLEKGDHPELDSLDLLHLEGIKIYQSLIGTLQWVIQIGQFDVTMAVIMMSHFQAAPRKGHLEQVKWVHRYLKKYRYSIIKINTSKPDYSHIPMKEYDWSYYTCYRGAKELLPSDAPKPLGKPVVTTSYINANLYHDLISGRSVTGVLHLWNSTPIDWYSKLQGTVEMATFGSEYIATRTCTEQIINHRTTLRYLGVPVKGAP
jgi:hypothetical protein